MGNWTRFEFGRDILPRRCYIFAGDIDEERKSSILSLYDSIEFHRHTVYERYIVSKNNIEDLLIFQVYGASTICDLGYILKDGGIEEIIFIGTAFGISKEIKVGDYVIPNNIQALDGLVKVISDEDYCRPNKFLVQKIIDTMDKNKESYIVGKTISVPSTFFHPSKEKIDEDCIALEMEFSSICYVAETLEMKCGGILIISDNEGHSLLDDQSLVYEKWTNSFIMLKDYLDDPKSC